MRKNINYYVTRGMITIIIVMFICVTSGIIAKNIFSDMFGITNPIIQFLTHHDEAELIEERQNVEDDNINITEEIDWESLYPFESGYIDKIPENPDLASVYGFNDGFCAKYLELAEKIISKIYGCAVFFIPAKRWIVSFFTKVNKKLNFNVILAEHEVIYMENSYLTESLYKQSDKNIEEIADSISEFDKYLEEKEIPFLFSLTGTKVCPTDKQLSDMDILCNEFSNENADKLLAFLNDKDVDNIDFRKEIIDTGLDWYDCYYITDHHWTTETGLWAAGVLADRLNKDYGFSLDSTYFDPESYEKTVYENLFLGSHGKKDAYANCNLEAFAILTPKYETDYSINIPSRNINDRGEYSNTLVDKSLIEEIKVYSRKDYLYKPGAYNYSQIRNDAINHIENHLETDNNKKILFMFDSFAWYTIGYLSSDIYQIDALCPSAFSGSIHKYIEESNPDMVIVMYYSAELNKAIDWDSHNSLFDFR